MPQSNGIERMTESVRGLLTKAFLNARLSQSELHSRIVNASSRMATRELQGLFLRFQKLGRLDMLIRCVEDDFSNNGLSIDPDVQGIELDYFFELSQLWLYEAYEIVRILKNVRKEDAKLKQLYSQLRLARVPLAKGEVAGDSKIKNCFFEKRPAKEDEKPRKYTNEDETKIEVYPLLGFNPQNGAVNWQVLDTKSMKTVFVNRRELSDQLLNYAENLAPLNK